MREIELCVSTGDAEIDRSLRGLVGVFETAYPGGVRAYYLTGSYAEGTVAPTSDLDVTIVFKDGTASAPGEGLPGTGRPGRRLASHCDLLSTVPLGISRPWEHEVLDFAERGGAWSSYDGIGARLSLKLAARLLYGEDIRERVPLPSTRWWARALWAELSQGAIRHMGQLRGRPLGEERLVYPLLSPDPQGEFFGYDRVRRAGRDRMPRSTTRGLLRAVLAGANASVAWRTGRHVIAKQDIAPAYGETVGGAWAGLITAIDQTCRVDLGYLIPEATVARRRLRELCAEAPGLENHILAELRGFLLEELAAPAGGDTWLPAELAGWLLNLTPDGVRTLGATGLLPSTMQEGRRQVAGKPCLQAWVARTFERVRHPGDERVEEALTALSGADAELVRRAAEAAAAAQKS